MAHAEYRLIVCPAAHDSFDIDLMKRDERKPRCEEREHALPVEVRMGDSLLRAVAGREGVFVAVDRLPKAVAGIVDRTERYQERRAGLQDALQLGETHAQLCRRTVQVAMARERRGIRMPAARELGVEFVV